MKAVQRNRIMRAAADRNPFAVRDVLAELRNFEISRFLRDIKLVELTSAAELEWRDKVHGEGLVPAYSIHLGRGLA